jgi:DNA repair photolyase
MNVIYEPKGRAKEYSDLACNLYRGCTHGCLYCYAPACMRTSNDKWHAAAIPRTRIIDLFEKDAAQLRGDPRKILFSFLSDPYQPLEATEQLTRKALEIVKKYGLKSQILTKGGKLAERDFGLFKSCKTELGVTLCFMNDTLRQRWEPDAAPVSERLALLKAAHEKGIYTWVSLEPVIDPDEALAVIRHAHPWVRRWKVGKLNHMKAVESKVDWKKFHADVKALLLDLGAAHYIKEDLRAFV